MNRFIVTTQHGESMSLSYVVDSEAPPLTEDMKLVEDLEMDTLDVVEFVMALDDELGVEVLDEDAEEWVTLGDVLRTMGERHGIELALGGPS